MERRGFFSVVLAAVVGWFSPKQALVPFYRMEKGRWVRRQIFELRVGDKYWCEHQGWHGVVFVAESQPYLIDGVWGITGSLAEHT